MLEKGAILKNRYKIIDVAGRGGQSSVYRARDMKRGYFERNEVAIKEMRKGGNLLSDMINMDFFQQEVMILSKLRHPYLPRIFDIFTVGGNLYIVEEFIEGKTLEQFLRKKGRIPPKRALELAIRVAGILDFLHQQNPPIYYRDLKPSNLLMQPGRLYLVDFSGCYIPLMGIGEGVAIRTRGYCPPEAYKSTTADPAFDVYTMGMLIYRMVTGIDVGEFSGPAPPLNPKKDRLPANLVKVVNKAINKNKLSRYHTIWEMRLEMEKVLEELKAAPREKAEEGQPPPVPKIPAKVKIGNFIKSAAVFILDVLVFLMLPLLILRPQLAGLLPTAATPGSMPWFFYLVFFFVLIIHLAYRHWLDFIDFIGAYNRFLHFPIRKWMNVRPINWLVAIEITLVLFTYFKILTL